VFFRRANNQVKNGDGNVQIAGDVGTLEIGIPHAEHFKRLEEAVNQATTSQQEIQAQLERLHSAEKELLSERLEAAKLELKKLKELRQNPGLYFELASDATATLSSALTGELAEKFHEEVTQIKSEINSGKLAAAEAKIDFVFERFELSSKMEAELLDAQSSLAFLRLRLGEAESRAKRAFYLDPTIDRLNGLLDHLEIGDRRSQTLSEFQEGKLQINAPDGSDEWVRLIATEIVVEAEFGEMKLAKNLMRDLEKFVERSGEIGSACSIAVSATQASLAAMEHKHHDVVSYGKKTISLVEELDDQDLVFILRIKGNVASALGELGQLEKAIPLMTECVEGLAELGELARYHYGIRLNNLGDFLTRQNQPEQAEPLLRYSIQLAQEYLPEWHPSLIRRRGNLATAYYEMDLTSKAIATLKEIVIDTSQLNDHDKESTVKVMMTLFNHSCEAKIGSKL